MKSNLFKSGRIFDDDAKKGILTFCELSDSEFNQYLIWYSTKVKENSSRKPEDLLPLIKGSKYSAKEIINAFSVCFFIIYYCFDHKDNIDYIIDDLIESEIIKNEFKNVFSQRFTSASKSFESEIKDSYVKEKATSYKNRLLNFLFKCEIVPKFEPEFDLSKSKIENYEPKLNSLFPIVKLIFAYENNFNNKKSISFYIIDDKSIDDLIDSLLSIKIELNEIKKHLPIIKNQVL